MPQQPVQKYQVGLDIPVKRNVVMNGAFNLWQRGITANFTGTTGDQYLADRWRTNTNIGFGAGQGSWTQSRTVDQPPSSNSIYAWRLQCTASISAGPTTAHEVNFLQHVEGYNFRPLLVQRMTLSFWVKSNVPGTYGVAFLNNGADQVYVTDYTINVANTWEYKTITTSGTPATGLPGWNFVEGSGIKILFTFAAGTPFKTGTTNVWANLGNVSTTNAQTNLGALAGNFIQLGDIQLEPGTIATPFEIRPFGEELALCQRYYEKSYTLPVFPGTANNAGEIHWEGNEGNPPGLAENSITVYFSVSKRIAPTVVFFDSDGNTNRFSYGSFDNNLQGAVVSRVGEKSFHWQHNTAFGDTVGQNDLTIHYTADAEL